MSKYCGKCGLQMTDDDFLCPRCGAIWGDRVYRVPKPPASASDCEDFDAEEFNEPAAQNEQPKAPEHKKLPRWLLPLAAVCVVLACVLFVMGSDWMPWAGEGSTAPSTTAAPETNSTTPTKPNLPYTVYTVKFVDPYGTPIAGVRIENPWNLEYSDGLLGSSSTLHSDIVILPAYTLTSDENGNASFILFHSSKGDAYVNILSIPQGYDQSMVGQTKYFAEGQTQMLIVLKFSDEPPLEIDPIVPPGGDEENTVYTLRFVDPDGNPVSGVKIYNPIPLASSAYLYSDVNGMILIPMMSYKIDAVVIAGVPEGYSKDLVDVPQYFEGRTNMPIVLDFEKDTEIEIPDIPTYAYYPITMDGDMWLYEPLQSVYLSGQTVRVKITYNNRMSCMLFANGVEITDCTVVDDQYWQFVFEMPEEAVELKLRLFYSDHLDEAAETMIREYYRQIPDAKEVHLMNYYGQYGDAIVGMLDHYDTDTDAVHYEVVANYTFVYTTQNMIVVLVNGEFITLMEAYMEGHLTDADVAEIYRIHLMVNQE